MELALDEDSKMIELTNLIEDNIVSAYIVDVTWDRILMHIKVALLYSQGFDYSNPLDFYLVNSYYCARAKFKVTVIDENHLDLELNFTNPGYDLCLPAATYKIYAVQGENIVAKLAVSDELAATITSKSAFFAHNKDRAYLLEFILEETDLGFYPCLRTMDAKKIGIRDIGTNPAKKPTVKKNFFKKQFGKIKKNFKKRGKKWIKKHYKRLNASHQKNSGKKNILFLTEQHKELGANLALVKERLYERGLDKDFNIYTSCRAIVSNRKEYGFKTWLRTVKLIAKADKIFVDDHVPLLDWLELDKSTQVVQLWHAGAGYKSVGYSRWGHKGAPAPYSCHRQYTYGICESKNVGEYHAEAFGISIEKCLPTGMPRMDSYIDPKYRASKTEELNELYPLCKNKKVVLFAPTYRGVNKKKAHYPFEIIDLESLYETCGDEYVVFFKFHPWVETPIPIPDEYKDRFIDVTSYKNINDMFYITDLLITDYSSNVFEYSLMNKPALFFAYDEYQYSYTRGFHREYREYTPGKIVHSFNELIDAIKNKDFEFEKMGPYVDFHFDHVDSNSTDRVVDWLVLDKIPEKYKKEIEDAQAKIDYMKSLYFINVKPVVIEEDLSNDQIDSLKEDINENSN